MVLLVLDVQISVSCVDTTPLIFGIAVGKFAMSEIEKNIGYIIQTKRGLEIYIKTYLLGNNQKRGMR